MRRSDPIENRTGTSVRSLTVMFTVLTLLCVYIACSYSYLTILFYFLAAIFPMGIMVEKKPGLAIVSFAVVLVAGLLLVAQKPMLLPYCLFFGHYAIGKYYIDQSNMKHGKIIAKLVYFNAAFVLCYVISPDVLLSVFPGNLPKIAFVIIMEFVFLAYDFLYTQLTVWYTLHLRNNLKRSTY